MGEPLLPATAVTDRIFFELDRFERAGDDRLELSGRWYGVRGRRFVRPTLTLTAGAEKLRALADLEHKPWAAEEGEEWQASFTCQAEDVAEAQLAVAPDIAVLLPAPGSNGAGPRRLEAARPRRRRRARTQPPPKPPVESSAEPQSAPDEPAAMREELRRLRAELEQAEAGRAEVKAAFERRNAIVKELRQALAGRLEDEQERVRAQQGREQELAQQEARERGLSDRERGLSDRERGLSRREAELDERERTLESREATFERRELALTEREAMLEERDQALTERAAAVERREHELAEHPVRAHVAQRPALHLDAPPPTRRAMGSWAQRVFAVLFLLAPLFAVAILTKLI